MSKKQEAKQETEVQEQVQEPRGIDPKALYALTGETLLTLDNVIKNTLTFAQASQILPLFKIEGKVNIDD